MKMSEVIEIRFKVYSTKDQALFDLMKRYSEVNWSEVSRIGIMNYLNSRKNSQ